MKTSAHTMAWFFFGIPAIGILASMILPPINEAIEDGNELAIFNFIEAGLWFFISIFQLTRGFKATGPLKNIRFISAYFFLVFGISDIIEIYTGAWYKPWWLLLMKAACLLGIVVYFLKERKLSQ